MNTNRLVALALVLSLVPASDPRDRVFRVYDLEAIRAARAKPPVPSYGGFLGRIGDQEIDARPFFISGDVEELSSLSSEGILDVLNAALAGAGDKPAIEVIGDRLVVGATDAQHKIVAAVMKGLAAAFARPVTVDVSVYVAAAGAAPALPALVAAGDVAKVEAQIAAAGKVVWSGALDAGAGSFATASSAARIPCIADFNTQVAKKAKIAEPVETVVPAGVEVALAAVPVRDGAAVHLVALVSRTDLLGVKRFDTRARDIGPIEIPTAAGTRLAATATVPAGGALVLRGATTDTQETIAVLRPRAVARAARLAADAGAAPVAVLGLQVLSNGAGRALPDLDAELERVRDVAPPPITSLAPLMAGGGETRVVRELARGVLLATGRDADVQSAIERARALEESELATVSITCRVVRANDAASAATPAAPIVASVTLAASARRSAGAIVGLQETAVVRYQAQIAEEAEIADPIERAFFRGLCVRARLVESREGGGTLDVECLRADFGPRERVVLEAATGVGDVERVPRRVAAIRRTIDVAAGAPVVLGEVGTAAERLFVVLVAAPL